MLEEFSRHLDQEANQQGLADTGDMLVGGEKVIGGKTVKQKYVKIFSTVVRSKRRVELFMCLAEEL